jgi:hypothetical protein
VGVPLLHQARNGRAKVAVYEQRQPYRRMIGISPFDAVAAMRRQVHRISWPQDALFRLTGNHKASTSLQKHDPFSLFLVVPESLWRDLTERDDALQPNAVAR